MTGGWKQKSGWIQILPASRVPFTFPFLSHPFVCLCVSRVRAYLTTDQQLAPPRTGNVQGRTQRAAAARVPNQRVVLMGRGEETRVAVTNALEARQQHARETAELVAKALTNLDVGKENFRRWKAEVGPVTIEEFIEFGNNCVQPGYTYFSNLYIQEEGKLHNLYMAFKGAEIFDPLRVKAMSEEATILQVDLLARFGFPEFTPEFLEGVKKEIPRYRRMARAHFEWNSLDGAEEY